MTTEQKRLLEQMRSDVRAMEFDISETLDRVLPAHAVDWRRKFSRMTKALDAIEAGGKCNYTKKIGECEIGYAAYYQCEKCGHRRLFPEGGPQKAKFCPGCGREIEASE